MMSNNKNNNNNNDENLFRDVRDMVFMSAYIYQHAALIKEARGESAWWEFWASSKEKENLMEELTIFSTSNNDGKNKTIKDMLKTFEEHKNTIKACMHGNNMDDQHKIVCKYEEEAEGEQKKDVVSQENNSKWTTKNKILEIHANPSDERASCVYTITKDTKYHRIIVTFRGTSNGWDWLTDVNAIFMKQVDNPVVPLIGNTPKVALHRGFANALDLAADDNDDGKISGKIDTILKKVKKYIEQEDGAEKYRLCVTGHSMGGALATLLGFYAAANDDPVYTKNGPVTIFSCSSPRVGNTAFLKSFQFLEEEGSLRHARVRNEKDPITMAPYLGGMYRHVGMEIKLRDKEYRPLVNYPLRQLDVSYFERVEAVYRIVVNHGCPTLYDRIKLDTTKRLLKATKIEAEYRKKLGFDPTIFTTGEHLSSKDKPLIFPKTGVSLIQEKKGNFVVYDIEKGYKLWESKNLWKEGKKEGDHIENEYYTHFQGDGNLVTRSGSPLRDNKQNESIWSTATNKEGQGKYFFVLSADKKVLSIRKNSPTSDDAKDIIKEYRTVLGERMKDAKSS